MIRGNLLGIGNTANIYEIDKNKVIKLFKKGYPLEAINREYLNAKAIEAFEFSKPHAFEVVNHDNQTGIIYEKVKGRSLLDFLIETKDIETCAKHMVSLHKKLLNCSFGKEHQNVMGYKAFLRDLITRDDHHIEALRKLENLSDGDTLCHGDFHPGNIFISEEDEIVIDFMNICRGHYLYDIARTLYLIQYTPVPKDHEDSGVIKILKDELGALYLTMMGIERSAIEDYIEVIRLARFNECPEEFTKSNG